MEQYSYDYQWPVEGAETEMQEVSMEMEDDEEMVIEMLQVSMEILQDDGEMLKETTTVYTFNPVHDVTLMEQYSYDYQWPVEGAETEMQEVSMEMEDDEEMVIEMLQVSMEILQDDGEMLKETTTVYTFNPVHDVTLDKTIAALSLPPLDTTATDLWIDLLFQSSVESLEKAIKEGNTWLDSTATKTAVMEVYTWLDSTARDDGVQQDGSTHPVTPTIKQDGDAEVVTRAQEEGRVDVVFPGTVSQHGCCQLVLEILKDVLYQRQQLPMTYDQLKSSQRCQASKQNKEVTSWTAVQSADLSRRKNERSLQQLDILLEQLEELFCLSLVPRVLLMLGGSPVLPKELYEINMEAVTVSCGDRGLQVSSCLRQLFSRLMEADIMSDTTPVRLMSTTIMVLAHRDCGVAWFRPKLQFKVPTRVNRQVIALSTDYNSCRNLQTDVSAWKDYIWFQAPAAIKGFSSS